MPMIGKIIALFLLCMLLTVRPIYAEKPREGASYIFDFYQDNANNRVIAPLVSITKEISNHFFVGTKVGVDAITSATRKSTSSKTTNVKSGEDGEGDGGEGLGSLHLRYAPSVSITYDKNDDTLTAGGYYSVESTYVGRSLFAAYTRRLNLNNTVLGIALNRSYDYWKPAADRNLPDDKRHEGTLDLSATQLLSPKTSLQFTYSSLRSEGFIALPTQTLVTDAFTVYEQYPGTRNGTAYAGRFVLLLDEPTSFHAYYRYYRDDWHIQSNTMNLELYRDLSQSFVLGVRYRYYTQGKAFFAKDLGAYTPSDPLIAVDYRMYAFRTNTVGAMAIIKPSWSDRSLIDPDKCKLRLSADYFSTSNNNNILYVYHTDRLSGVFTTVALDYDF